MLHIEKWKEPEDASIYARLSINSELAFMMYTDCDDPSHAPSVARNYVMYPPRLVLFSVLSS